MKTQAVVFPEADRFEVTELTLAEPGPGDIVVRTLVSAISPGTERWILRGKHIGTQFPCVPGYHRIGVVEDCGSEVTAFEPGDVVYGSGGAWAEDIVTMWGAHVGLSVGGVEGYWFVGANMPNQFELDTLAFAILASVSNRGMNFCGVRAGQQVLIIGAGFVGACAAQLAMLQDAQPVVVDKDPDRLALVQRVLPAVLSVDDPELEAKLNELAPCGFDILHDTVGHAPTTDALVQHVCSQGTLLLQAQYFDKERCAVDLDQIKIKELTVKTTCGVREQDWLETMTNIRTRRLKIAPLITHRFSAPGELLNGYELLHIGKPHNLGIVFRW